MNPVTLGSVLPALQGPGPGSAAPARAPGGDFGDALGQALGSLEKVEQDADRDAQAVALGGGNLHETALALAEADTAMRVAVKVRNKIVDAYQEIMRMNL